jgi:hypothetical protein
MICKCDKKGKLVKVLSLHEIELVAYLLQLAVGVAQAVH